MKLLDWILGREPVVTATGIAAVVTATLGALTAFDVLDISVEQVAAVGALVAVLAGWAGRSAVTPLASPQERKTQRIMSRLDPGPVDTVADDSRLPDEGGIPLALIILLVVGVLIVGGVVASCDALFTDPDEEGDLGMPALVLDHDGCWEGECGGYDEDNGGYGDDRGGDGRFGGGRSGDYDGGPGDDCRNACGNTIIVPSPGGGEERPR
jgi:hypothetical protein